MPPGHKQLALDLSQPINHHEKLHHGAHGTVVYWERRTDGNHWFKIEPGDPVRQLLSGYAGASDTFLTVNEFWGWRRVRLLKSLRACYVDIDGVTDLEHVLDVLQTARLPVPSFAVYSGRGIHLYWLLEPTHSKAVDVWQQVQDTLIDALSSVNADRRARDCVRVLRLIGTKNGKNGEEVRGVILSDAVWKLHELADEVLGARPRRTAKVYDLAAAGARKGRGVRPFTKSIYSWWHKVYLDMVAITDHHWFGGVPEGHRDQVLFVMAVALSWYTHSESLKDEILATAKTFTPTLTEREVLMQIAPVLERAEASVNGERRAFNGKSYDPRYNYRAETLREYLGDIIPAELHGQLRALAPAEVIKQRKKERDAGRDRVAEGRYKESREAYLQSAENKAATARLMRAQGKTTKEIVEELGVSRMTVSRYLRDEV